MRHSLWTRLMAVFLGVIVVGVIIMVVSLRLSTTTYLRRRVLSNDLAQAYALAPLLATAYTQKQTWNGMETLLASTPSLPLNEMMGPGMMDNGSEWMQMMRSTGPLSDRVIVLDTSGRVVIDTGQASVGEQHPLEHLEGGVSIVSQEAVVGTVLVGSMIEPILNPADEDFLRSVNLSIFTTALTVGVLALIFGSLLFRQMIAPLRALSQSAEAIANGDLRRRVDVHSADEIGRAARSFNQMANSLVEADAQRRNLMADIAHELRTPLTIIQGNLEALLDGVYDLTPDNIALVHRHTLVLSRLVTDLQDLAMAEAGQLRLERKPTSLTHLIAQATESLAAQAVEQGVTLKDEIIGILPSVEADAQRLTQVLLNLLSNALRHTPQGGTIIICAEVRDGQIAVSVRDTGIGIAPEDLPHIFERFYRADRSRARATGGSGLGLTIAKQIVEAHGGRIEVTSVVNQGTVVTFILPPPLI